MWDVTEEKFSTAFGFWTQVRDKTAGEGEEGFLESVFKTYKDEILNMCYDDGVITSDEILRLSNRELLQNEYSEYHLLFSDVACPTFSQLNAKYHHKTRGRFAASQWTSSEVKDYEQNIFVGTLHTLLQKVKVGNENYNYFFGRGVIILDSRNINANKTEIGDPNYITPKYNVFKNPIPYESVLKRYCDSGEQPYASFGPCLNLKGYRINGRLFLKQFHVDLFVLKEIPLVESDLDVAVEGDTILEHDTVILIAYNGKFYAVNNFDFLSEVTLSKDELKIFTHTYDARDAKPESMFHENHRYAKHTCSPMPMNINPHYFAPVYDINSTLMMLRPIFKIDKLSFSRCQPRQDSTHTTPYGHEDSWGGMPICEDLEPNMNYGQSCVCDAGFANVRYVDNNQPFSLHGGCTSLPGDSKGLFIDYKKCYGINGCTNYIDTPFCCGYDSVACNDKYKDLCVDYNGLPALDTADSAFCNRPFSGCVKGQRYGIALDDDNLECSAVTDIIGKNSFKGMANEWVSVETSLKFNTDRSLYVGSNTNEGVVYVDGKPRDSMRSNYAFMTSGCYACTDGRYNDLDGQQECKACPGGKYSVNLNNPWRKPLFDENFILPESRGELVYPYEWWKINGYPTQEPYVWHEVNEWLVDAPERPYFMDLNGKWHYSPTRSLQPIQNIAWQPQEYSKSCQACPDNFASIPLAQDHLQNPDSRYGNFPNDAYRSIAGQTNCLICPPGYDTGKADHLKTGISRTPSERCPTNYPYAVSSKEYAPYYGSYCCESNDRRINPYYFHENIDEACENYIRCQSEGFVDGFYCVDANKDVTSKAIQVRIFNTEKELTCSYIVPTNALQWEENICESREKAAVEGLYINSIEPLTIQIEYDDGQSEKSETHFITDTMAFFKVGKFSNIKLKRQVKNYDLLLDSSISCNGFFIDSFTDIIYFNNFIEYNGVMEDLGFVKEGSADEDCAMEAIKWHEKNGHSDRPFFSVDTSFKCFTYTQPACEGQDCVKGASGAKTMQVNNNPSNATDASCFFQSVLDKEESSAYCRKCPQGKFSNTPGSNCLPCSVGKYQDEEGQISCKVCENSKYQFLTGSKTCFSCPAGSEDADDTGEHCNLCKAGTYSEDASECKLCPTGTEIASNFDIFSARSKFISRHEIDVRNSPLINFDNRFDYTGVHGYGQVDISGNFVTSYSPFFEALRNMQLELHDELSDCTACVDGYINPGGFAECRACPVGTYSSNGVFCEMCATKTVHTLNMFKDVGNFICNPLERIGGHFKKMLDGSYVYTDSDLALMSDEEHEYLYNESFVSFKNFITEYDLENAKMICDKMPSCSGIIQKTLWNDDVVYQIPSLEEEPSKVTTSYNVRHNERYDAVSVTGTSSSCSTTKKCIGYYEKDGIIYDQFNLKQQKKINFSFYYSDFESENYEVAVLGCLAASCDGISIITTYDSRLGSELVTDNDLSLNVSERLNTSDCELYAEENNYVYWDTVGSSEECVVGNHLL